MAPTTTCATSPSTSSLRDQSSRDRLNAYFESTSGLSRSERDIIIPALAIRSYHLPGNSYWQDWFSYLANNHPIFGICCHHRLHPVRTKIRVLSLLGSIAFGLAATNIIWLYFQQHDDPTLLTLAPNNVTSAVPAVTVPGNSTESVKSSSIEITQSMLVLWTLGGGTHALFDNTIWFVSACVCCLPRGHTNYAKWKQFQKFGTFFVLLAVVLCTAVASLVVLLRVVAESNEGVDVRNIDNQVDQVDLQGVKHASSFRFLISYCIELTLALFVYYPMIAFMLFSGVLGCGRLPLLGGRPYEVRCEERTQRKDCLGDGTEHESA